MSDDYQYDYQDFQDPVKSTSSNVPYWIIGLGCLILLCIGGIVASAIGIFFVSYQESGGEDIFEPIISELDTSDSNDAPIARDDAPVARDDTPVTRDDSGRGDGNRSGSSRDGALPAIFEENFQTSGNWDAGTAVSEDDPDLVEAEGEVQDGVYVFSVFIPETLFWAMANESLGDGVYTLEATAVDGPENNGYGMIFLADNRDNFYIYEISSDGFVWIGHCTNGCETAKPLVEDGWFSHSAVNQGIGARNDLQVTIDNNHFTFHLNGTEIADFVDSSISGTDIGLMVETIDEGDVEIHFDNFSYTP